MLQIAMVLFPGFTALDLVGPFGVLAFVPDAEVTLVAERPGPVTDDSGRLTVYATAGLDDVPRPDVIVVPGGTGQSEQMDDGPLHEWLRRADATSTWTTSVCSGSLILAAAGLLRGRRATTHWLLTDQLADHGAVVADERVVVDGHYVTGAGVSAGIDMALRLTAQLAGEDVAQARQLSLEYAPEPPFDAGSPKTAPRAIVDDFLAHRDTYLAGRPQPE